MEPLKNMFNRAYYTHLSAQIALVHPEFDQRRFIAGNMAGLDELSLNERLKRTSLIMHDFLPSPFEAAVRVLEQVIANCPRGYSSLVFPDYVATYGLGHFEISMAALKKFTVYGSSEFAIREFLRKDFNRTIRVMEKWAADKNMHVRRLASEGSRPRLPWSFKLEKVIDEPFATCDILEKLKCDEELYVRKSVANHLNDISKDNPDYMLALISRWDLGNPHTAWIARHASRSLIKKGNPGSLSALAFEKSPKIQVVKFRASSKVQLGQELMFEFELNSKKKEPQKLAVDYIIHYRKKDGRLSPKVFKLKEVNLQPGQKISITKKQRLQDFSTRKHFPGVHKLQVQVNGKIVCGSTFTLVTYK
jgi:3-methyladenine DNA glycosylase AlkC